MGYLAFSMRAEGTREGLIYKEEFGSLDIKD
jgi:hypothetical protein